MAYRYRYDWFNFNNYHHAWQPFYDMFALFRLIQLSLFWHYEVFYPQAKWEQTAHGGQQQKAVQAKLMQQLEQHWKIQKSLWKIQLYYFQYLD